MRLSALVVFGFLCHLNVIFGQQFNDFQYSPYVPQYVPANNDQFIQQVGATLQARYDQNKKYRDNLISWIFDLKSKTSDKEFLSQMDDCYGSLRAMDNGAFESLGTEIDNVKFKISEDIDKYNARVKKLEEENNLYKSGIEEIKSKRYNNAVRVFTEYISIRPDVIGGYYNRGLAYQKVGNYAESISDLNKFIELKNDEPIAYSIRGWDKYNLKDYSGAVSDFNDWIKLDQISPFAYYGRAEAYARLEKFDLSIADDSRAIELKADFSMAYNDRGWYKFKAGLTKEAIQDLDKAIALDEKNAVAYDSRQEVKFALSDYKGCLEDCNMAILLDENMSNSIFFRGRVYYKQGKKDKACEEWKKAGKLGKFEALQFISKYCEQ